jgi:phosphatidylglycerophosphate synthase
MNVSVALEHCACALSMKKNRGRIYYFINGITLYRLLAAPVLLFLILYSRYDIFKWLLALSFFTDAIDGYLARRYNAISVLGARLDSIADDLTIAMAIFGIIKLNLQFILHEWVWIAILVLLFVVQTGFAFARYRKMTAFHTYTAKVAAVVQAAFIISFFFVSNPPYLLFYICAVATCLDLIEEILLIWVLPVYRLNVKGLYWVLKRKRVKSG